jgi:hypothetical protein
MIYPVMLLHVIYGVIVKKSLKIEKSHFSLVTNFINTGPIYVKKYSKDAQKYSTIVRIDKQIVPTSGHIKNSNCVLIFVSFMMF